MVTEHHWTITRASLEHHRSNRNLEGFFCVKVPRISVSANSKLKSIYVRVIWVLQSCSCQKKLSLRCAEHFHLSTNAYLSTNAHLSLKRQVKARRNLSYVGIVTKIGLMENESLFLVLNSLANCSIVSCRLWPAERQLVFWTPFFKAEKWIMIYFDILILFT